MRARVGIATALCALALCALALPGSASAYVIGGRAWPGHTITYFNADRPLAQAVALAAHAWNTSGAHVRLVAVPRSRARVIIRRRATPAAGPAIEEGSCFGYGDIGYQGRVEHIDLSPACTGLIISAAVATHEFGHVLGLNHPSRGCAVMTPAVWQGCPFPKNPWQYRCAFARPDDVRGLVKLYGGRVRPHPSFCTVFATPASPSGVKVGSDGRDLIWHNPPAPRISLRGLEKPRLEAVISVTKDSCPKAIESAMPAGLPVDVHAGRDQASSLLPDFRSRLTAGNYCYAVFVEDQFGRAGVPATAMFTIPNQPPTAAFVASPDFGGCVQFDDTSKDPDGRISAWQWDFGAPDQPDNSATASSQYHCYQQSGTYTVTLTVTDDLGAKATTTQQFTVTVPPPEPPPEQGL